MYPMEHLFAHLLSPSFWYPSIALCPETKKLEMAFFPPFASYANGNPCKTLGDGALK